MLLTGPFENVIDLANAVERWYIGLWRHFGIEVYSGLLFSLSPIVQASLTFFSGRHSIGHLALSKPSMGMDKLLKMKSLYQIHETSFVHLNKGDLMSPCGKPLNYAWEADFSMCYSSILAEEPMPVGSPLVFSRDLSRSETLLYRQGPHPYTTLEFQIVNAITTIWQKKAIAEGLRIIDNFQFSISGSFCV